MRHLALLLILCIFPLSLSARTDLAYKTLEGYAKVDEGALIHNYAFDVGYASVNSAISLYGLSRFSKHQDEINVIYTMNLLVGSLLLYRSADIISENGLFQQSYLKARSMKNLKLREEVADFRLLEISNSARQLRKISSIFTLVSSAMIAVFSEGKKHELLTSLFMAGNSIFYLGFYESYGEDAYDKYFFFRKAYPEFSFTGDGVKLALNFTF